MPTYSQARNADPIDWWARLEEKNISKYRIDASDWVTCACGNQCATIPRNSIGAPLDTLLKNLGDKFSTHVFTNNHKMAKDTLHKIEARAAELIKPQ